MITNRVPALETPLPEGSTGKQLDETRHWVAEFLTHMRLAQKRPLFHIKADTSLQSIRWAVIAPPDVWKVQIDGKEVPWAQDVSPCWSDTTINTASGQIVMYRRWAHKKEQPQLQNSDVYQINNGQMLKIGQNAQIKIGHQEILVEKNYLQDPQKNLAENFLQALSRRDLSSYTIEVHHTSWGMKIQIKDTRTNIGLKLSQTWGKLQGIDKQDIPGRIVLDYLKSQSQLQQLPIHPAFQINLENLETDSEVFLSNEDYPEQKSATVEVTYKPTGKKRLVKIRYSEWMDATAPGYWWGASQKTLDQIKLLARYKAFVLKYFEPEPLPMDHPLQDIWMRNLPSHLKI